MLLVVETITWKPHIETAMEIAYDRHESGEDVLYCNLRDGLPICEDQSASHALINLPKIRIRRSQDILQARGVPCLRPGYARRTRAQARSAARKLLANCRSLEDVKQLSYGSFRDIGWGAISSTASLLRASDISPARHGRMLRRFVEASILVYDKVRDLINEFQPSEVLFFNGRFATTRAVMRAAESLGVAWRIHERGRDKDHYWITACTPHDVDRIQDQMLQRWTPAEEAIARDFFESRRSRVERSWHSFTTRQTVGRLPEEMNAPGDWVTFFTSSEDELLSIGDSMVNKDYPSQLGAIRAVADAVQSMAGTRLCVRVHPHIALKGRSDRRKWASLELPGALVLGPEDPTDSYALIERSKVVCSYGSTVGIEATYWGRPSLLFSRSYYDRLGVSTKAGDAAQVSAFLRAPIVCEQDRTLAYGAFWSNLGQPYHHYQADQLHRGRIFGTYLDDSAAVRTAKAMLGPLSRRFGSGH